MAPVAVSLLGGFSVVTTASIRFPTRKTESLFAFLLLNGQTVDRNRLAGVFWPDMVEDRARRNLSTALWRLKSVIRSIPAILVDVARGSVKLTCKDADVDVFRFRSVVESLPSLGGEGREMALRDAEALYKGDLLEGFADEWCEDERRYLRTLYVRLLRFLIETNKTSADFEKGISYARKLVQLDPLNEESQRELMLLYHLSGDRRSALDQFEIARQTLQDELGIQPSPSIVELHDYIRARGDGQELPSNPVLESAGWTAMDNSSSLPIIGRDGHMASLMRVIEHAARGLGAAVVVSGEVGVGKTRLAESVAVEAGLRGYDILQGRCLDLQDPPPYHVFIQALWPRISSFDKPGGGVSSPLWTLIRALAPEASPDRRNGISSRSHFFDSAIVNEALLSLLGGTYNTRPTLLILEDIHRIDKASTTLLVTLLGRLSRTNLCVLLTIRSGEHVTAQMRSLLAANGASEIRLEGLTEQEVKKLIRAALHSKHTPFGLERFLWERSNGVPLFALELLKFLLGNGFLKKDPLGGWSMDQQVFNSRAINVPSRVQEVIRQRIEGLDPEDRKVLCAAAVLGAEVEFNQLRELVGAPDERFIEATDRLVGAQLLQETKIGFRFPHESMRLVALSVIKRRTLRPLHRKVADLVLRSAPGRTEDLAWHYEEAGDSVQALRYAEASGDKARTVYANSDAATWYSKALEVLSGGNLGEEGKEEALRRQSALLLKRQEVLDLLGDRRGQSDDIDEIRAIAEELDDQRLRAHALFLRANLLMRTNADEEALKKLRQATRLFRTVKDLRAEARVYETAGLIYNNLRKYELASAEFRRALRLFHRLRDHAGKARGLFHIGMMLGFENKGVAGVKFLDQADALLREIEDHRSRAMVKLQKGILYRCLGRLSLSESHFLSGLSIMTQIGDRVGAARNMTHLAYTHAAIGRLRDAMHESEKALRIAREAKDVRAQILILNNTAYGVYRITGNFTRAKWYVTKAMRLVSEAGSAENMAPYADTMAAILLSRGELPAALHWARRSEALCGTTAVKTWIGVDTHLRLGSVYLEMGQYAFAMRYLCSARNKFARGHELAYQTVATAELSRLHLARRDLPNALRCAREVSDLLRRVDGVEEIQRIYWSQYQVFHAAGLQAAARRALRQAYRSIMQQASTLKGRFRRIFLNDVKINREVLEEVSRNHQSIFNYGTGLLSAQGLDELRKYPSGLLARNEKVSAAGSTWNEPTTRRDRIDDRRRLLKNLFDRGRPTQAELAAVLGVSLRTVRNDLAALRSQGLTPKST